MKYMSIFTNAGKCDFNCMVRKTNLNFAIQKGVSSAISTIASRFALFEIVHVHSLDEFFSLC